MTTTNFPFPGLFPFPQGTTNANFINLSDFLDGDGTDETAKWNAMWAGFVTAAGGASKLSVAIWVDPDKTFRIDGQWIVPYELILDTFPGQGSALHPQTGTIKIFSAGFGAKGNLLDYPENRCGTLDLRYDAANGLGKIVAKGIGSFILEDVTIIDGGSGTHGTPFLYSTNTLVKKSRVLFRGANGESTANQTAHVYGGQSSNPGGTILWSDDDQAPFQGYGSAEEDCFYQRIQYFAHVRDFGNGISFVRFTMGYGCGGNGAAMVIDGGVSFCSGLFVANGVVEMTHYTKFVTCLNTIFTTFDCNGLFDAAAPFTTTYYEFGAGAERNRVNYGAHNDIASPPYTEVIVGGNIIQSMHQGVPSVYMASPQIFDGSGNAQVFWYNPGGTVAQGPIWRDNAANGGNLCQTSFVGSVRQLITQITPRETGVAEDCFTLYRVSNTVVWCLWDKAVVRITNQGGNFEVISKVGGTVKIGDDTNSISVVGGVLAAGNNHFLVNLDGSFTVNSLASTAFASNTIARDSTLGTLVLQDEFDVKKAIYYPAWTPASQAGLSSWSDRASDFRSDAAGLIAPASATDLVYSVTDLTANGVNVHALAEDSSRPIFQPTGGSFPGATGGIAVKWDGTNAKGLFNSSAAFLKTGQGTLWCVIRVPALSGAVNQFMGFGGTAGNGFRIYLNAGGGVPVGEVNTTGGLTNIGFGTKIVDVGGSEGWVILILDYDGANVRTLVTGGPVTSSARTGTITGSDPAYCVGASTGDGTTFALNGPKTMAGWGTLSTALGSNAAMIAFYNKLAFYFGMDGRV
jgi:hypothetical protein